MIRPGNQSNMKPDEEKVNGQLILPVFIQQDHRETKQHCRTNVNQNTYGVLKNKIDQDQNNGYPNKALPID